MLALLYGAGLRRQEVVQLDLDDFDTETAVVTVRAGKKSGRMRRMVPHAVYKMVSKRAREAGVKTFSPHDLRRTFVSDLLDAGADIATVQELAGQRGHRDDGEIRSAR